MTGLEEQYHPKLGEAVVVSWEKEDGTGCGGTEGVIIAVLSDEVSGKYLVIDRSTYQNSFKSALFSMNILDLRVLPVNEICLINKTDVRKRPPGISEKYTWVMDAFYQSKIDFNSTLKELEKRSDCEFKRGGNENSEAYQLVVKEISELEETTFNISCKGTVQITCKRDNLDRCIDWLQKAVVLLPEHKRLVLIPTMISYRMNVTYKDPVKSAAELINRIALDNDGPPVVLPIGWAQRFFSEMDANPLEGLFPRGVALNDYVIKNEKKRKKSIKLPSYPIDEKSKECVDLDFHVSGVNVNKFLGADAPLMRVKGLIKSAKDEEGLMNMWLNSRSDVWQWFESGQIQGRMLIHDLTINRKKGEYTVDLRKYSGNEF